MIVMVVMVMVMNVMVMMVMVMVMMMVMVVIINIINRCTFFKTVYCSHRERKILARLAQQK